MEKDDKIRNKQKEPLALLLARLLVLLLILILWIWTFIKWLHTASVLWTILFWGIPVFLILYLIGLKNYYKKPRHAYIGKDVKKYLES